MSVPPASCATCRFWRTPDGDAPRAWPWKSCARPDAPDARLRVESGSLLTRFDEVPHDCTDPTCPGAVNKRKLEVFNRLLYAVKLIARAEEFKGGTWAGELREIAKTAIARAGGRETTS